MLKKLLLLLLVAVFSIQVFAQNKKKRKTIKTTRVSNAPKIDGILDDEAWENAELCKDFVIFKPENGDPVPAEYQTVVKVIYDDDAIYISAQMNDPDPAGIPKEFAVRDNFSQADFFLVTINPNDDGQNPFQFIVQSTGNQADSKVSNGNEDFNWSAVWESNVSTDDKGWNVEMKIPYRALRFANRPVQSWGFNFHRRLEKLNSQHTWTHVDNSVGRWTQYDGLITDFRDIKPPTRLNLYPYASATTSIFEGNTNYNWSVGMDIKYGLTDNFTLDATLIPDFSQVGFDDVVLNLGPFEQEFTEQRQFFTEGTELFNIANLFYSRRIGASPIDQFDIESTLSADEEISNYPGKVTMLNAIKISGRTKKGLGIGFFNAITERTDATINNNNNNNNNTGEVRTQVINPFTNYNILVLDQQFNQNSTISLINTNVTRDGRFRDANVTGLDWHLETKNSKYNADGSVKMSVISDDLNNPNTGYTFDNSFGYNSGNWNWEVGYNFENKDFNPNDFGILFSNNEQTLYSSAGWKTLQPTKRFNRYSFNFYQQFNYQHSSGIYTGYNAGLNYNAQTRNRFSYGGNFNYGSKNKDYFEPRQGTTSGIYFLQPERKNLNVYISTNSQKKLELNANGYYTSYSNQKIGYGFSFAPRYRFTNQFSLNYRLNFNKTNNDQGYVDKINDNIILGQRDRKSYTSSLSGTYNFDTNTSISIVSRYYWGTATYDNQFYELSNEGKLNTSSYNNDVNNSNYINHNINFTNFNTDVNFTWQFAPGSQLIAFYRNSIFNSDTDSNLNFSENLDNIFDQSQSHTFSVRFVYFIDYNKIKHII